MSVIGGGSGGAGGVDDDDDGKKSISHGSTNDQPYTPRPFSYPLFSLQSPLVCTDTGKTTTCPLALNLRLYPLPKGYTQEMLDVYEAELADPSGIPVVSPGSGGVGRMRMRMEGVGVFDGCGVAFGLHDGEGMR